MDNLTNPLKEKFLLFHDIYEQTREHLLSKGVSGAVLASEVWEISLRELPLAPEELRLYKQLIAMHSVNGGELFGDQD